MQKYLNNSSIPNQYGYRYSLDRHCDSSLRLNGNRQDNGQNKFAGYHVDKITGSRNSTRDMALVSANYFCINECPLKSTRSVTIGILFRFQGREQEIYIPILQDIHDLDSQEQEKRIASHLKMVMNIILSSEPGKAYTLQGSSALSLQLNKRTTAYAIRQMEKKLGVIDMCRMPLSEDDQCDIDLVTPHKDHGVFNLQKILLKSLGNNIDMFNIIQAEGGTEIPEDIFKLQHRKGKESNRKKCFNFIAPITQEHNNYFDKYENGETKRYRILTSITTALMVRRANVKNARELFHVDITHPPEKEPDPAFVPQPPYQKENELIPFSQGIKSGRVITFRQCLYDLLDGVRETKSFKDYRSNKFMQRIELIIGLNNARHFGTTHKLIMLPENMDLRKEMCSALSNPGIPNRKSFSHQITQTDFVKITEDTHSEPDSSADLIDQPDMKTPITCTEHEPVDLTDQPAQRNIPTFSRQSNTGAIRTSDLHIQTKAPPTELHQKAKTEDKQTETTGIADNVSRTTQTIAKEIRHIKTSTTPILYCNKQVGTENRLSLLEKSSQTDPVTGNVTQDEPSSQHSGLSIEDLLQLIKDKEQEIQQLSSNPESVKKIFDISKITDTYDLLVMSDEFLFMRKENIHYRKELTDKLFSVFNIINSKNDDKNLKFKDKIETTIFNQKHFINMLKISKIIRSLRIITLNDDHPIYKNYDSYLSKLYDIDFHYLYQINHEIDYATNHAIHSLEIKDRENTHIAQWKRQKDICSTTLEKQLTEIIQAYLIPSNQPLRIQYLILEKMQQLLFSMNGKRYPEILLNHINLFLNNDIYQNAVNYNGGGLPGDQELEETLAVLKDPLQYSRLMSTMFQRLASLGKNIKAAIILTKHLTLITDENQPDYPDDITKNELQAGCTETTIINIFKAITPATSLKTQTTPGNLSPLEQAQCQQNLLIAILNCKVISRRIKIKLKKDEYVCQKRILDLSC